MKARVIESALLATALAFPSVASAQEADVVSGEGASVQQGSMANDGADNVAAARIDKTEHLSESPAVNPVETPTTGTVAPLTEGNVEKSAEKSAVEKNDANPSGDSGVKVDEKAVVAKEDASATEKSDDKAAAADDDVSYWLTLSSTEDASERASSADEEKASSADEEKASSAEEEKASDADDEDDKSWGVSATIGFDLGLGAFTKNEYARKVRSRFTMGLEGYYTIPVIDVSIHLATGFSQWMSKAGGSNGKYEFRWADSSIGFSREIWHYKEGEFSVGFDAALDFAIPTSTASINTNLYTSIQPTLSASIKYSRLSLAYAITYSYNAHKYTSVTLDPDEVDVLSRSTGNEIIDSHNIAIGGVLAEHDLSNTFVLGIDCIKKMLSLSIGLAFSDSWSYDNGTNTSDDEFVGKYAKVGRGHSQYSQGSIALSYTPIQYVVLSLGMVSTQPWKTADNKTIRFPWFDTESPSKNYTKFLLSASFVY